MSRGGARTGAGRPRKPPVLLAYTSGDPVEFLRMVMRDPTAPPKLRLRAAVVLSRRVTRT